MEYGEKFNTYSLLVGALLALIGSVALVVLGALRLKVNVSASAAPLTVQPCVP